MENSIISQSPIKDIPFSTGLTSKEARTRLEKFGPNTIPDTALNPLRRAFAKFWAPVPWMLEAAFLLEITLGNYVEAAIIMGRRVVFQRIQTYTMNSIIKKIAQIFLLAVGLVMTGHAILTPMLMVIVMITGDFLSMSLTTDTVQPSPSPNVWKIGRLTVARVIIGVCDLLFCISVEGTIA